MRLHFFMLLACALICASCATPEQKAERARKEENSRVVETQRMNALNNRGAAGTERWSELVVIDPDKTFDLGRSGIGSSRAYNTGNVRVKDFNYAQKVTTRSYKAGEFWGTKPSAFTDQQFATRGARTSGNYEIPNATKKAATKTAPTKDAREAGKTLATRGLHDGDRQYLGKETEKMKKALSPNAQVGWSGDLQEMTIEDLRELLNKNK